MFRLCWKDEISNIFTAISMVVLCVRRNFIFMSIWKSRWSEPHCVLGFVLTFMIAIYSQEEHSLSDSYCRPLGAIHMSSVKDSVDSVERLFIMVRFAFIANCTSRSSFSLFVSVTQAIFSWMGEGGINLSIWSPLIVLPTFALKSPKMMTMSFSLKSFILCFFKFCVELIDFRYHSTLGITDRKIVPGLNVFYVALWIRWWLTCDR